MTDKKRLGLFKLVSYGFGSLGEGLAYNLFYAFFIYFLTSVAGVSPAMAGTISLVAVIWGGVADPLVGSMSDNFKSPKGRRIPFILYGSIPLGLIMFLLFSDVNISLGLKGLYFCVVNILFWFLLSVVDIPYISLGTEITDDYDTRTKLRTSATLFLNGAAILVSSFTLLLVKKVVDTTGSEIWAWRTVGLVFGAAAAISFLWTAVVFKGKEKKVDIPNKKENVFKDILLALKNKEFRKLLVISLAANLVLGGMSSVNIYMLQHYYLFNEAQISIVMLAGSLVFFLGVLPIGWMVIKIGKRHAMTVGFIMLLVSFGARYLPIPDFANAITSGLIYTFGMAVFWTVIYAMAYDVVELDELITGKRREGIIISCNSFIFKAGAAVGMWIAGLAMEYFIPNMQTLGASANDGKSFLIIATVFPAIYVIIGMIANFSYKLTKSKFENVTEILNKKKSNQPYSTESIKELL